mmetsp:Transcript_77361/g.136432  ORF Transcript_77361/g.136432 Transcript_77361/m.136432 type:complete len:81 (+) Transcript_77361:1718-1960(+)
MFLCSQAPEGSKHKVFIPLTQGRNAASSELWMIISYCSNCHHAMPNYQTTSHMLLIPGWISVFVGSPTLHAEPTHTRVCS